MDIKQQPKTFQLIKNRFPPYYWMPFSIFQQVKSDFKERRMVYYLG